MIVNFKLFENNNNYNVGDYILMNGSYFADGNVKEAKIIENRYENSLKRWYELIFIFNDTIKDMTICNMSKVVIRKLIPEEIDKFELEYNLLKYNL